MIMINWTQEPGSMIDDCKFNWGGGKKKCEGSELCKSFTLIPKLAHPKSVHSHILASFPGLPTVKFLIACSMQK